MSGKRATQTGIENTYPEVLCMFDLCKGSWRNGKREGRELRDGDVLVVYAKVYRVICWLINI